MLETLNQLLTTVLLTTATAFTATAIILLRRLTREKQPQHRPRHVPGETPAEPQPQLEMQKARRPQQNPAPSPKEYSWILRLGEGQKERPGIDGSTGAADELVRARGAEDRYNSN